MAFPGERVADDRVEVVKLRSPVQHLTDAVCGGDRHHDVAGAAVGKVHREIAADGMANRVQHFADRIAAAVAAIQRRADVAAAQIIQRRKMRAREIADMDEIADAGAVGRGVIGAVDIDPRAAAEGCLDRDLDEMRGARRRQPGAQLRIGAGDVEVAERDVRQRVRGARVPQHHLVISFDQP